MPSPAPDPTQQNATVGVGTAFSGSMPAGLTPAQQTAYGNVQKAFAPAPSSTSSTPAVEPTVLSSSNTDQTNTDNAATIAQKTANPVGQSLSEQGFVKNADGTFAEAPSGATPVSSGTGQTYYSYGGQNYALGAMGTATGDKGTLNTNGVYSGNAPQGAQQSANGNWVDQSGNQYAQAPVSGGARISSDPTVQSNYDALTSLKANMDATGAATIQSIKDQYQALIRDQTQTNAGANASVNSLLIRGGTNQSASSAGIAQAQISYGIQKISDLVTKENSAVIAAQQAMQNNDFKVLDKQITIAAAAAKDRQVVAEKLSNTIMGAQQTVAMNKAVLGAMQNGTANPADILSTLQTQGYTNITAKDVADTLAALNPDQKQIYALMQSASQNKAPPDVIKKMGSAATYADALAAASGYLSTNPEVQQYNLYKSQQTAAGKSVASFDSWMNAVAYNKAYSAEKGKVAGQGNQMPQGMVDALSQDPNSQSILAQTGLSGNAFFWLTGRSSQLPRDQATRNAAAAEATKWANTHGIDISTLPAQYEAYNKVLAFNTTRQSMASIQENEITATIKNLEAVAPSGNISGLNWGNVVKIWGGQQINDPIAQQYAFHLEQLRNEVVAYNLIAQGQINADGSLKQSSENDVARVDLAIKNGVSSGSLSGLSTAVTNSTNKMKPVLQSSVDAARLGVWNLFGVGNKYQSSKPENSPQVKSDENATASLTTFGATSSDNYSMLNSIHSAFPTWDATTTMNYLKSKGISL